MNLNWYYTLNHPPFTPPAWVFAPAWTVLYLSMFAALVLYGIKPSNKDKSWGYVLFFVQLIINLAWTPVFFYFKNISFALVIIILLDILVLMNIIEFYKVSKKAGKTLLPYFIWLIYATYLNTGMFVLN